MAELARRTTICKMRRAGSSVSDIIKSTGYAKSTVYRVVSAFNAEGKVQRSRHSPRSDRKRTKTFRAGLKRTLKSDPSQPISKRAQKRSVSRSNISRAVKEDLGIKSYVKRVFWTIWHTKEDMSAFLLTRKSSLLMRLQIARKLG